MVFSSVIFLFVFLPITIGVYFIANDIFKNIWLLAASLFFYSWGEPKYIILMLISICVNYILGLAIDKVKGKKICTLILIFTVTINVGILLYFKYFNFFVYNINRFLTTQISVESVALPIGISFYTFQSMSYVIDVYRNHVKVQKNILKLGLYISFFPQLIAGPIVRYIDIEKFLDKRSIDINKIYNGVKRFAVGFSKKVLIADQLAVLADTVFEQNGISALIAWTGAVAYTLQIYFDFSGYSDMAIGLGKIFGFEFMNNFNYPYISSSVKEFWRRWHISLSTWFKDYVYIPLGGSRCSKFRACLNLSIVFFLTGFWHGASWNFIVWGLYYAAFLILERGGVLEKLPVLVCHVYTIIVVIFGWVLFRANGLKNASYYIKNMFMINDHMIVDLIFNINKKYLFFLLTGILFSLPIGKLIEEKTVDWLYDGILIFVFIVAISYVLGNGFSPFLYFRF